jgi:DNA-directed RNA polymerase subunit RPC12/RpoP
MRNYFGIPYSFVCANLKCTRQFEQALSELVAADKVSCPYCGTTIDLTESKRTGDLSRIFRDVHALGQ